MRKSFMSFMVVFFVATIALVGMTGSAWSADKKYEINFSSEYPPKHPTIVNGYIPMFEEIKKKSKGRLDITYFAPKVLCPNREHYVALANGVVDMAFTPQGFTLGKMPLAQVASLPLMFESSEAGGMAIWDLYKKFPEWRAEYKEIKTLWHHVSALFELHMVKDEVKTLEDLQGKKIIVWLPVIRKMATALGANPVETNSHDTYLALQRGMADGVICPIAPMRSMKITEVTKYHTLLGLGVDAFWGGINKDKYNSLPPDLQKLLMSYMGDHIVRVSGKTLDDGAARDTEWMKSKGHTFYTLPPAEKQKWIDKVRPLHVNYVKEMKAKGYSNAQAIYDATVEGGKKYQAQMGK